MIERIYVAGPYSARGADIHTAPRIVMHNVNKAIQIGNELIQRGHHVFIPHLSFYVEAASRGQYDWDIWYEIDNSFIDHWATALFYIGPSMGADMELKRAQDLLLMIYTDISQVPAVKTNDAS